MVPWILLIGYMSLTCGSWPITFFITGSLLLWHWWTLPREAPPHEGGGPDEGGV